ncbi:MAG TPA: ThiF family adenylyltransferase [Nitrospira sp.]|jgi:molybdopterin/thiamine biosynthesis adenylyltransferase|nr:ThiF family adenylyltransferase [Nitrospira sp.]
MEGLYPLDEVTSLLQQLSARRVAIGDPELPPELRTALGQAYLVPVKWNGVTEVILYLSVEFPDERPIVYFKATDLPKCVVPHVNRDGQICTLPIGAVVNPFRPAAQIVAVLQNAQKVVETQYPPDEFLTEVEQELVAYWGGSEPILFLTDATLESHRIVHVDLAEAINKATKKRVSFLGPMPSGIRDGMQVGLVLDIPRAHLIDFLNDPARTISQEASWRQSCALLADILSQRDHSRKMITAFVLARCETSNGQAWLGGLLQDPLHIAKDRRQNEERLVNLPLRSRFHRCAIDSLRTERLLRRIEGPGANTCLMDKSVALVGCGSLGSFMADLLVRSGVQRMLLVDKESLESANLARHILDATGLFLPKASQLCSRLRQRFPESNVEPFVSDVRRPEGIKKLAEFGSAMNLIATGETNTDMTLSELCRRGRIGACCFVWVESGLRGCHVIYQPARHSHTLTDLHGPGADGRYLYLHRLIGDPDKEVCHEHACQFTFTPYSAIDLAAFAAVATRKVVEWLNQPPQELQILRWRAESCNQWETLEILG